MEEEIKTLLDRVAESLEGAGDVDPEGTKLKTSFLYYYSNSYRAGAKTPLETCRSVQTCTAQAVLTAQNSLSNQTSCSLLGSQFAKYANLMDNKIGVNNLADDILNELSAIGASGEGPASWRSQTDKLQLMDKMHTPACANQNQNGVCTAGNITLENIKLLLMNKKRNEVLFDAQERSFLENHQNQGLHLPLHKQDFKPLNKVSLQKPVQKDSFLRTVENRVFGGQKRNVPTYPTHTGIVKRSKNNGQEGNEYRIAQSEDASMFRTAGTELRLQNLKKYGRNRPPPSENPYTNNCSYLPADCSSVTNKKSLGGRSRAVKNQYVPPFKQQESEESHGNVEMEKLDERLQLIDPKMVELIQSEIIDNGVGVGWDDIAGLNFAKTVLQEIVVLPMLRPDIFTGLRRPPRGILLFGPPGTGKTLIGKCVASQSRSTFFSISASSLTSKWIGDGEKMVRALFTVARVYQPAVIFIDEIDSLLGQRSDAEHESSRRLKTEFLVHLDGTGTKEDERILLIGATNRPQDLDEAVRRRFVKRLYIPLPDGQARCQIITNLLSSERNNLTCDEVQKISELTDGYSAADMKNVCQEASLAPLRALSFSEIVNVSPSKVRPVVFDDFKSAVACVRSSVASDDLTTYVKWDEKYGAGGAPK